MKLIIYFGLDFTSLYILAIYSLNKPKKIKFKHNIIKISVLVKVNPTGRSKLSKNTKPNKFNNLIISINKSIKTDGMKRIKDRKSIALKGLIENDKSPSIAKFTEPKKLNLAVPLLFHVLYTQFLFV